VGEYRNRGCEKADAIFGDVDSNRLSRFKRCLGFNAEVAELDANAAEVEVKQTAETEEPSPPLFPSSGP
jgi:hypothetical protein